MATDPEKWDLSEANEHDEKVLAKLGYKQVLYRSWGTLTAVALTISAMSVLTSISASFATGLTYGGPAVCVWGWVAVSFCTLCLGLGMAELAAAYPTSGGMYYWNSKLAGRRYGPWACWVTGWLNLLGQIAAVSSVSALTADLITTMVHMATGLRGNAVDFDNYSYFGVFCGVILLNGALNSAGLAVLTVLTQIGALFNIAGVILLSLIVPIVSMDRRSAKYVFTSFETGPANEVGITNWFYAAALGLLLPAFSYTGVDGPVHMAEEVTGSQMAQAKAILSGIGIMFVGGLGMVIALLFAMGPLTHELDPNNESGGKPIPQILYDVFNDRFGTPAAGIALQIIPIGGAFFCVLATTTYVTRIMFCYSRDRAVPLSHLWQKVDSRTKQPQAALWAVCAMAMMLGLPILGSETAFNAILSLSTATLIIAYTSPIFLRITIGAKYFEPGPFCLGLWAYPIGIVACIWCVFATVIFVLPTELPVNPENLNYASVALIGTFLIANIWFFFPKYGARHWFHGPARTVADSVAEIETGRTGSGAKGVDDE